MSDSKLDEVRGSELNEDARIFSFFEVFVSTGSWSTLIRGWAGLIA